MSAAAGPTFNPEMLGLRSEDVDLDGEKLEVVQTLQRPRQPGGRRLS